MKQAMLVWILAILGSGSLQAQDCAAELRKLGNAPGGGFLMIKFDKDLKPAACGVKGTSDKQNLKGNSGVWTSGNKYTSAAQTIVMYDAQGNALGECKYDAGGKLVVNSCFAEYVDVPSLVPGTVAIDISWFMVREVEVVHYEVTRSNDGGLSFTTLSQVAYTGTGVYNYTDTTVDLTAPAQYKIEAICNNGTRFASAVSVYTPRR
jgi:hypothetical protein